MKIIVTGCFGFIGFNFINYLFKNFPNEFEILGIDNLSNTCSLKNKDSFQNNRFQHIDLDINNINELKFEEYDLILNFAAESHVDNSISDPLKFSKSNVNGLINLLNYAKKHNIERFIHVSTDEVYGSTRDKKFLESDKFNPASPYSASKASAEHFCNSYRKTYDQNILIVRPCNNYGFFQQPEKLIPFSIISLISGNNIEIYGEGKNIRNWMHANDTSSALAKLIEGDFYQDDFNLSTNYYLDNLSLAKKIIKIFDLTEDKIEFVKDRPGHDFKYATSNEKILNTGWTPLVNFDESLVEIVEWYKKNKSWWIDEYNLTLKNRKKRFDL